MRYHIILLSLYISIPYPLCLIFVDQQVQKQAFPPPPLPPLTAKPDHRDYVHSNINQIPT